MNPQELFPLHTVISESPFRRWQRVNDIHCRLFDLGFASAWFAQQGESEPVSGETEAEACAKLARELGIGLWEGAR